MKKIPASAVRKYEKFHGHAPSKVSEVEIPEIKALVYLGDIVAVEYRSDKMAMGSRKSRVYRHLFKGGVKLYCDPSGRVGMIHGGKFIVTDWLRN